MDEASVRAVVGLRRYGKSSHAVRLTAAERRVVYYDTLGDDYKEGVVCHDTSVFERFWRGTYRGRFRITLKPQFPLDYFPRFCELVWECAAKGNGLVVVIDECHLYFRGATCHQAFTRLITAGGHRDTSLLALTQKPKLLSDLFRSQTTVWDVFALREGRHVDYMVDRLPGVDRLQLTSLRRFEYLHYEDGADCYWRCKDDLGTGRANMMRVDYAGQAASVGPATNPGGHQDSGEPLAR